MQACWSMYRWRQFLLCGRHKTLICRISSHTHNMNKRKKQCSKCLPSKNNIITVLTFHVLHDVCMNSASLLINASMPTVFVVRHKTFICRISSHTNNMNKSKNNVQNVYEAKITSTRLSRRRPYMNTSHDRLDYSCTTNKLSSYALICSATIAISYELLMFQISIFWINLSTCKF